MSKLLWVFSVLVLLSGCGGKYYGLTESEWHALSAQEQEQVIRGVDKLKGMAEDIDQERIHDEELDETVERARSKFPQ